MSLPCLSHPTDEFTHVACCEVSLKFLLLCTQEGCPLDPSRTFACHTLLFKITSSRKLSLVLSMQWFSTGGHLGSTGQNLQMCSVS